MSLPIFSDDHCLILYFSSGKMIPISRIINSTPESNFLLSPDSILIQWRPVTAVLEMGPWDSRNHTMIVPEGVFMSWLVNLSTEEIMGFIIQSMECLFIFLLTLSSDPVSSTSFIYFIQSWAHGDRYLSISNPGINISNKTLSSRAIHEYVYGVSDQRVYLLNSGIVK